MLTKIEHWKKIELKSVEITIFFKKNKKEIRRNNRESNKNAKKNRVFKVEEIIENLENQFKKKILKKRKYFKIKTW